MRLSSRDGSVFRSACTNIHYSTSTLMDRLKHSKVLRRIELEMVKSRWETWSRVESLTSLKILWSMATLRWISSRPLLVASVWQSARFYIWGGGGVSKLKWQWRCYNPMLIMKTRASRDSASLAMECSKILRCRSNFSWPHIVSSISLHVCE